MARERYTIRRIGGAWLVFYGRRRDLDLTRAFRHCCAGKAVSTRRKIALFLERFLNFQFYDDEPHDAFIQERFEHGRDRVDAFLEAFGCQVTDADRDDGAANVDVSAAAGVSALPSLLKGLRRFYARLARDLLRPRANPLAVDNWHRYGPDVRRELAQTVHGDRPSAKNYTGAHYVVLGAPRYAIRMEDAARLGAAVLAAGTAFGWPDAICDQVTVMQEEGARWIDSFDLNCEDWARASALGRALWAPNKGSAGARVKKIIVSEATVVQLRASFDRDPTRPSMDEIEGLLAAGDWAALRAIPLFPSVLGRPYSYHTFNQDYFRPAMEAGGVVIHTEEGAEIRPTPHRLRHARIQEEADHIYQPGRTDREVQIAEERLQDDVHIRSKQAFYRYIGPQREKRAETAKAQRTDDRLARRAVQSAPAASVEPRPMSAVERRIQEIRKNV